MATYKQIADGWFYRRLPKGKTFEAFEAEDGTVDRKRTRDVFEKMRQELPKTVLRFNRVDELEHSPEGLRLLDRLLTPKVAQEWMAHSDPDDPNNFFKLTLSEFSVYLGDTVIETLGGEWKHARMPNYFESLIEVMDLEIFVFDMIMKKCSDDVGHEELFQKWESFKEIIEKRSESPPWRPN